MPLSLNCEYCKKYFITRKRSTRVIRFCSQNCSRLATDKQKIEEWEVIHENWKNQSREEYVEIMQQAFEKFIAKSDGCWLWNGSYKGKRLEYGTFTFRGKGMLAHRAGYFIYKNEIPEGMLVLHKCDVPRCVNPDHLWLGNYLDNQRDKMVKGRGKVEKLNPDKVREIKKLLRMGVMHKRIMQDYGISNVTVHAIQTGRTWKDIE
jgi:hypothetical protein